MNSRKNNFLNHSLHVSLLTAAILALSGGAYAAKPPITFVSWGGSTQKAQAKAWAESFTKKTGIKVIEAGPTNYGKFAAMVRSGHVKWDVVDVEGPFAYRAAKEGLLTPLNFKVINPSNVEKRFRFKYGVGDFYYSFVLAYNNNSITAKPSGWKGIFNLKEYPGQRTLYKYPEPGVLEMALLASGVQPKNLYPLDLARAFKELNKIKNHIVWWGSGAQSQQLLASGNAPIGSFWNGRVYYVAKSGAPVTTVWHHNLATADFLVVPKGAPHAKEAMQFIANAVSAKPQAKFSKLTAYAPVNPKASKYLPKALLANLPTGHEGTQITLNIPYWAKNAKKIDKAWNQWITQ